VNELRERIAKYVHAMRWDALALGLMVVALTISFVIGWYFDDSIPHAGRGFYDQTQLHNGAERIASGELVTRRQLHFPAGYMLLGAASSLVSSNDPYMPVSYMLLLGSATLCYLASREFFPVAYAVGFVALLFFWDGMARSLHFASEIFAMPWNNQVAFLVFSFWFWVVATQGDAKEPISLKLTVILGAVNGFAVASREELVVFLAPMGIAYLLYRRVDKGRVGVFVGTAALAYSPHAIMKTLVFGTFSTSGRARTSYGSLAESYLSVDRLATNLVDVIYDSSRRNIPGVNREALLQVAPWLWLAPFGIALLLITKRASGAVKGFAVASLALFAFYMAGTNMSVTKLKFHCIRYITPAFILFNFAVVFVVYEVVGRRVVPRIRDGSAPTAGSRGSC
jgi:hypothetical protein